MKINYISKNNKFDAVGELHANGEVTVFKGSRISSTVPENYKTAKEASLVRNDDEIVSNEFFLLKDVTFSNPSTAAQFVSGNSINGWNAWRTEDGRKIAELRNKTLKGF